MDDKMFVNSYKVIRKIASGGVGTVYLAENIDSKELFALKLIPHQNDSHEKASLQKYSTLAKKTALMQILEDGDFNDYFYYIMPLADSLNDYPPTDLRYIPKTLASIIEYKAETSTSWFSPDEIKNLMLPIFSGLEILESQGLLHRDIKPENIIFINNQPILSDFGLLTSDTRDVSNIGTPFFLPPTWYINSKGNPDMWGIASCFYMLITGNYPDSIGRYAYTLPECYKGLEDFAGKQQYAHWHRCILRACSENAKNRFFKIEDFKLALFSNNFSISKNYNKIESNKSTVAKLSYCLIAVLLCVFASLIIFYETPEAKEDRENLKRLETIHPELSQIYKNGAKVVSESPLEKGKEIELKSYRDWLVFFANKKEIYLKNREIYIYKSNTLTDPKEKLLLEQNLDFDAFVFNFHCEPNLDLYLKHIDIALHPEKYGF